MECPKCRKLIDDADAVCPYCGTRVKSESEKGRRKKRKKAKSEKKRSGGEAAPENGKNKSGKWIKIAIAAVCLFAVIILAAVIIAAASSSKGQKYADTAAEYIGNEISALESGEDMHFKDESDYFGVNSAVAFDYVYESDSKIKSNGISYPKWAVFLEISDANFITDVTYTDFSVVKKDPRGEKSSSQINLDRFSEGTKQSTVLKEIDVKPYSISYSQKGVETYTYKYYYTRDNGDEQQAILRVAFSESGKYKYSTTELIYPQNM